MTLMMYDADDIELYIIWMTPDRQCFCFITHACQRLASRYEAVQMQKGVSSEDGT